MDKINSKFSEHSFKKGVFYAPFNSSFGDKLSLSPWALEALPEYIWISLILEGYGRARGLGIIEAIIKDLSKISKELCISKLSNIFSLELSKQQKYYEVISRWINPSILSPLTLIFRMENHTLFNNFFLDIDVTIDHKVEILERVIKKNLFHQTNEATDVRFVILLFEIYGDRLYVANGLGVKEALIEYPKIDHSNPKMQFYRPMIRSAEIGSRAIFNQKNNFCEIFWKNVAMLTQCNSLIIDYGEQGGTSMNFFGDSVNVIEYLIANNKEKLIMDEKFSVCLGIATYALKIYKEVLDGKLSDGILGRFALRTITEVYVTLKYMLLKETEQENVWKSFKEYGVGKYKYVVLKARELDQDMSQHHFALPVLDAILNEDKNEEFTDMDTRLFDNQNVRKKFEVIGENNLYDLYYEYDTNFIHGLWGAIRESSMVSCDNPGHKYHPIPDITFEQKLKNIESDSEMILKKLFKLISSNYEFPSFYLEKYGDLDD